MDILSALNWRYAVHKFDPNKKLSAEQLHLITETLRLSPSSFGLQPWKFVVVTDPVIRAQLQVAAWDQAKVSEASHLLVLCTLKTLDTAYIDRFVDFSAKETGAPREALENYRNMMVGAVSGMSPEQLKTWMQKQVYIALGNLLTSCAINQIDAAPMEGFDPVKFNEILELDKYDIESAVVCAVGYRSEDDTTAKKKKVRFSQEQIFILK